MNFFSTFNRMSSQLDFAKMLLLLMIGVNATFGYLLFNQSNNIRTIIVPSGFTSKFESVGTRLDNKYFDETGRYLSQAILTVSPNTINNAFNDIESFFSTDPYVIKATKEYFLTQNSNIKDNNIYQAFYPLQTSVNFEHGKFSVSGILRKNTGNVFISEERKTIEFEFVVRNSKLEIKKFEVK